MTGQTILNILGALGGRSFILTLLGLLAPVLQTYLHMPPELVAQLIPYIAAMVVTYAGMDRYAAAKTDGATSTSAMLMKAAKEEAFIKKAE